MTDENTQKQPLSMTRRYRRGLILTGVLCVLAMLTAATLLFQRSYVERVDSYIAQICDGYAAAYKAQDTHDALSFAAMLPQESARTLRFTLIDADGTVLFDSKTSALVYDSTNTLYAVMDSNLPNHADRPEFRQAMEKGSASVTRESETMQTETHYYALRIDTPDGTQVLRVGEDIANIWGLSADTLPLLCAAVVLILLAATLFSWWLTRRMVQPINHLAEHLDTIEADVPYEELIPLARTIQTDRKLREDNETMRREFTANVSHELKTPLTSISGYAELIETGMASEQDTVRFAHGIHNSANRLLTLINDIIRLSELDGTEEEADTELLNLHEMAQNCVEMLKMSAEKHKVTIALNGTECYVTANRQMMEELLYNLCDNAIRYNNPGGSVDVQTYAREGHTYLVVKDTGIGISEQHQGTIFKRFYREDAVHDVEGIGIGLYLAREIVTLQGGYIWVVSEVGKGSTFSVFLLRK